MRTARWQTEKEPRRHAGLRPVNPQLWTFRLCAITRLTHRSMLRGRVAQRTPTPGAYAIAHEREILASRPEPRRLVIVEQAGQDDIAGCHPGRGRRLGGAARNQCRGAVRGTVPHCQAMAFAPADARQWRPSPRGRKIRPAPHLLQRAQSPRRQGERTGGTVTRGPRLKRRRTSGRLSCRR